MEGIIGCESRWNPTIQSHWTYSDTNVPRGYSPGDREQSFGLVQIHLPAHTDVSYSEAIDPEFSVKFLAENLAAGRHDMWSCYGKLAMR